METGQKLRPIDFDRPASSLLVREINWMETEGAMLVAKDWTISLLVREINWMETCFKFVWGKLARKFLNSLLVREINWMETRVSNANIRNIIHGLPTR